MFSFFAWISLIGGLISAVLNFIRYSNIEDPLFFTNGFAYLIMSIVSFAVFVRLSRMEREIDYHSRDIRNLYSRTLSNGHIERKDDSKEIEEKKIEHTHELVDKLDAQIGLINKANEANLKDIVMSPLDWPELQFAQKDAKLALFRYFDSVFPMLLERNAHFTVIGEVCNEAYRITGSVGDGLSGKNAEIMSYMCDCEQRTNGKSDALRRMCQKLDSIGLLDRGHPFGDRLK